MRKMHKKTLNETTSSSFMDFDAFKLTRQIVVKFMADTDGSTICLTESNGFDLTMAMACGHGLTLLFDHTMIYTLQYSVRSKIEVLFI